MWTVSLAPCPPTDSIYISVHTGQLPPTTLWAFHCSLLSATCPASLHRQSVMFLPRQCLSVSDWCEPVWVHPWFLSSLCPIPKMEPLPLNQGLSSAVHHGNLLTKATLHWPVFLLCLFSLLTMFPEKTLQRNHMQIFSHSLFLGKTNVTQVLRLRIKHTQMTLKWASQ